MLTSIYHVTDSEKMKKILERINDIIEVILGKKYYVCVLNQVGTPKYHVNSVMFRTKEEVKAYRDGLMNNRSYQYIETVSFRSHKDYINVEEKPKSEKIK